jgi:hypothetical protein
MATYARTAQALTLARGEALALPCSPDSTVTDTSITGWSLAFVVRPTLADLDDPATISATTANDGIEITSESAGTFTCYLTHAQTSVLPVALYDWEIWRTDSGAQTRLAFGKLQIVRSVQYPDE